MDRRILHAILRKTATPNEREAVRQWPDKPDGHREELSSERTTGDSYMHTCSIRRKKTRMVMRFRETGLLFINPKTRAPMEDSS
jgi:hypothetical protein